MKKQLIAIAGLAILSTPAMATKARMIALGENIGDNMGSLYFSDSRNIFQNAAYANDYKNMVIMEWGASSNAPTGVLTTTNNSDTDQNPQAEGGFLKAAGAYTYGLYLGAESPYTNEIRSYTRSLNNQAFHQDNQLDGFFAGESELLGKWGINGTYSTSRDKAQNAKQDSASIRLGMIKNKTEAFLNVALMNHAKIASQGVGGTSTGAGAAGVTGPTDEFTGKRGFEAGVTQDVNIFKVFGYVRHATWRSDANSTATPAGTVPNTAYQGKFDGEYWLYQVGAGKEHKLNDKSTLFLKAEYLNFKRSVSPKSGTGSGNINLNDYRIPVTIGLEHEALSWLTVRGSVVQSLVSETDNNYNGNTGVISAGVLARRRPGRRSANASTNVNAGITLKFGELSIDGVIGTDGTNNSTTNEKGALTLDNLASRVAMTYKF